MSAESPSTEVTTSADSGPRIITVMGQEAHVPETPVVEVKTEVKGTEEVVVEAKPAAGSEEQVDGEQRDEKGRFKPNAKERIAELTRKRHEAERDVEYWKNRALGTAPAAPTPEPVAEVKQPPARDQFESEEAYSDAMIDYKVETKLAERNQQEQQVKAQTTKAESWQSKLASARTEIQGYDAVMDSAEIPIAGHVAELIMEHDQGAKVVHHFALHPEELEAINAMGPAKAAFAIAEVANQFKAPDASSSQPAAKTVKVSEAPPPAARNVGAGRSTAVPLGELSMDDYVAQRKAQGASWAR